MVESQTSNLLVAGSIPVSRSIFFYQLMDLSRDCEPKNQPKNNLIHAGKRNAERSGPAV